MLLLDPQQTVDLPSLAIGCQLLAGVDEAGRGPLAGDVVAAAVILDASNPVTCLNDSKKLSANRRARCFEEITERAAAYAIARASVAEIDGLNILQASLLAMRRAVDALATSPEFVLVDGNRCPGWAYQSAAIVKGDAKLRCIAAASILAKVSRDRSMEELEIRYPGYGFAQHKGYPTRAHLEALSRLGPCPEHRRSFRPVADLLQDSDRGKC